MPRMPRPSIRNAGLARALVLTFKGRRETPSVGILGSLGSLGEPPLNGADL